MGNSRRPVASLFYAFWQFEQKITAKKNLNCTDKTKRRGATARVLKCKPHKSLPFTNLNLTMNLIGYDLISEICPTQGKEHNVCNHLRFHLDRNNTRAIK